MLSGDGLGIGVRRMMLDRLRGALHRLKRGQVSSKDTKGKVEKERSPKEQEEVHGELTLFADAGRFSKEKVRIEEEASETVHILGDALENLPALEHKLGKAADVIGAANLPAGLFFLKEGISDIAKGVKKRDELLLLHGVEHTSLGGASIIKSLESLEHMGLEISKSALGVLGPIGSVLGVVHGSLEMAMALKEIKDVHDEGGIRKDKLKFLDALSSVLIGGAMIGGTVAGGTPFGIALLAGLGVKLSIAAYMKLKEKMFHKKVKELQKSIENKQADKPKGNDVKPDEGT